MIVDTEASRHFLRTAYEHHDWIALFLKSYKSGQTLQRVGPLSLFLQPKVHAWLRAMNAHRFNVYVSVNAVREAQRTRTKDAIASVRHIFLDADEDGPEVLSSATRRTHDWPPAFDVPSHWVEPFARLAGELELPVSDARAGMARVRTFVERIISAWATLTAPKSATRCESAPAL